MRASHRETIFEAVGRDPVHPFPARMAPGIALKIISEATGPLRVLDPMMGSGTVLAVARSQGHRSIGFDLDPLAVLISSVWTKAIDVSGARATANAISQRARDIFRALPVRDAYPSKANEETRNFVTYWFDPYARRQLAALARAIREVRDDTIRDVLWCSFSRLIITKQAGASLAMDLAHSRPHKSYRQAPAKPFNKFLSTVDRVIANCLDRKTTQRGPAPRIHEGDARCLPLGASSVDLVITSPPYLNAIDYFRCSKFSLVWMGHSIDEMRKLRSQSVGTEVGRKAHEDDADIGNIVAKLGLQPELASRHQAILARYVHDMKCALREVGRVLAPGGKAVYVIGENTVRGTYVPNAEIVVATARLAGLEFRERHERPLPASRRYLPPPTGDANSHRFDSRLRREVVLTFVKPKASPSVH